MGTVHTDVGELELPVPALFTLPDSVSAALKSRAWRYTAVDNASSGSKVDVGWITTLQGAATTPVPTTADLRQSALRIQVTNSAANALTGFSQNAGIGNTIFRGDKALVGGFFFRWILAFPIVQADSIIRVGLTATAPAGGAETSSVANSIFFGADSGDANVSIITVDNGGTANKSSSVMTKAALATSDPNSGLARILEFSMYAAPNAASVICTLWDASNGAWILAPTDATATVTTRLPLNTQALRMMASSSTKTAVQLTVALIAAYGLY